ncbi:LmeA family phospholipid-binding protein [Cellulomonas sp. DKR-3]|uniref:LmeA family phospholipid-binding protein n=1 Tax=Cellulomonas fulva TaxID=2835530 RepID=A0ABS5TW67_9CELL|nr:DUF2993 domain-containing protein [Cellulomonas fulva]MBT0993385.1 LmeA family phospholipid-binding protein [Cellulomonas fulva]
MSARGWVVGVSVVVVLGAGVVVADRVALVRAQEVVADAIVENLDDVQGEPQVDIDGFPFLTQLLAGSLDEVTGHVEGATIGGLAMTDVDVVAHGTSTSEPYTAQDATVVATIPSASIQEQLAARTELEVAVQADGDVLRMSGDVLGIELSAGLVPRVEGGRLLVDVEDLQLGGATIDVGQLPGAVGSRLTDLEVPVEELPEGLELTQATVVADGVRVTAAGTDVTLPTSAP